MAVYNYDWRKSDKLARPAEKKTLTPPNQRPLGPDGGRKPAPPLTKQERNKTSAFKDINRQKKINRTPKKPQKVTGTSRPKVNANAIRDGLSGWREGMGLSAPGGNNPSNGSPPPGMTLDQWLGSDTTYNDQMSLFQKIYEDYMLSTERQKGNVEEDYTTALDRLGLERSRSLRDMGGDYASRGLLHSGLYGRDVAEYNTDYQNVVNDLGVDKNRAIEDLLESLGMFGSTLEAEKMSARQEAIRRYMERFASLPDGTPAANPDVNPLQPNEPQSGAPGPVAPKKEPGPLKKFTGNLNDYSRIKRLAIDKDMNRKQIRERLGGELTPAQRKAMRMAIERNKQLERRKN